MAPKAAPAHPPYVTMVSEAVKALKDRTGSSLQAIKKYIGAHYKGLPTGWEKTLSVQVKKLSHDGKLQKVKASYKLGEALKKAPKKAKVRWARAGRPAPCALLHRPLVRPNSTSTPPRASQVAKKPAAKKPAAKKPKVAGEAKVTLEQLFVLFQIQAGRSQLDTHPQTALLVCRCR